ncbi:gamma-glutamyl-gamma-aminobutyrate hydrolase family protein [Nakamurella flavida]|uniref:Gamma-glutamyl-gamma-aminobutyrate hydrolase family protein n=1 Tax=Nakamurella flavida TaxID=363630 RepID=A0A939C7B8_9ACTN|nr:gamma-glutamyl-gamma-aminobutyrate hydrolase family protein [Nakamurella flavida]MBM9478007.1 gamma-glutamyl-gamma-aminobutyrate hydrolase family protein [Nakamurella flavida]MDP9778276.1 putative glutamine amidotransferase [Nakamurella flavida]
MTRPVIGISTYRVPATWGIWQGVDAAVLPAAYADAVSRGGATPVLIPPLGVADEVDAVVARLDGLVIAGGSDVNPSRYGQDPHPATAGWRDDRDVSELALLNSAEDRGVPVLGICRGMQLLAVQAGGTLHQHLPDLVGHDGHRPGDRAYGAVEVAVTAGSRVADILGADATVPCHHHQAVATHPGFVSAAWAADGTLEAMERPGARFCVGVQWHPETDTDRRLFRALADAAERYAAEK